MLNLLRLNAQRSHQPYHCLRTLSTSQLKEYYNLLNVNKNSSAKEIKESFLRLSKVYHPDNKSTGSHAKFVALKQAYDAIKDGPPVTDGERPMQYGAQSRPSSRAYSDFDFDSDFRRRMNSYSKDEYRYHYKRSYRFGGPFRDSSSPWEDFVREKNWQKSRGSFTDNRVRMGRGSLSTAVIYGLIAWVILYSFGLYLINFEDYTHRRANRFGTDARRDYEAYQELVRQRKIAIESIKSRYEKKQDYLKNSQPETTLFDKTEVLEDIEPEIIAPSQPSL